MVLARIPLQPEDFPPFGIAQIEGTQVWGHVDSAEMIELDVQGMNRDRLSVDAKSES